MKVYSISPWAFWGIFLLILALPVSRHWRLLVSGERSTGVVTYNGPVVQTYPDGKNHLVKCSVVEFEHADSVCQTVGPPNFEYPLFTEVRVAYDPNHPSEACLLCFSGFYLWNYSVLPVILLVLWLSFYLSYNHYVQKQRFRYTKAAPEIGRPKAANPPKGIREARSTRRETAQKPAGGREPPHPLLKIFMSRAICFDKLSYLCVVRDIFARDIKTHKHKIYERINL
ncbi:MAG: DUF3592 domain-containing protein [Bacteroidales bacterium]